MVLIRFISMPTGAMYILWKASFFVSKVLQYTCIPLTYIHSLHCMHMHVFMANVLSGALINLCLHTPRKVLSHQFSFKKNCMYFCCCCCCCCCFYMLCTYAGDKPSVLRNVTVVSQKLPPRRTPPHYFVQRDGMVCWLACHSIQNLCSMKSQLRSELHTIFLSHRW